MNEKSEPEQPEAKRVLVVLQSLGESERVSSELRKGLASEKVTVESFMRVEVLEILNQAKEKVHVLVFAKKPPPSEPGLAYIDNNGIPENAIKKEVKVIIYDTWYEGDFSEDVLAHSVQIASVFKNSMETLVNAVREALEEVTE